MISISNAISVGVPCIPMDASSLLLDDYGDNITAAYSLRKLRTAYTGSAIRIRRFGDNAEQDIGFDSDGNLDTAAITSFIGSNNAAVVTWYEQSGQASNWNLTNSVTTGQPRIAASGTIFTLGGKPSIADTTGAHRMSFNTSFGQAPDGGISQPFHTFSVVSYINTSDCVLFDGEAGDCQISAYYGGVYRMGAGTNVNTGTNTPNTQLLIDGSFNGGSSYLNENNVSQGTSLNIGTNSINRFYLMGKSRRLGQTQELLIYGAELSNRADIANNINTYYSIYS